MPTQPWRFRACDLLRCSRAWEALTNPFRSNAVNHQTSAPSKPLSVGTDFGKSQRCPPSFSSLAGVFKVSDHHGLAPSSGLGHIQKFARSVLLAPRKRQLDPGEGPRHETLRRGFLCEAEGCAVTGNERTPFRVQAPYQVGRLSSRIDARNTDRTTERRSLASIQP